MNYRAGDIMINANNYGDAVKDVLGSPFRPIAKFLADMDTGVFMVCVAIIFIVGIFMLNRKYPIDRGY